MSRILGILAAVLIMATPVCAAPANQPAPRTMKQLRTDLKTLRQRIREADQQVAMLNKHLKTVTDPNERTLIQDQLVTLNRQLAVLHTTEDATRRELDRREHPLPPGKAPR